jgi:hypothetical protein
MLMLSKLYFKLLSSQRDFFQVESILSCLCHCTAGRLPLFRLLWWYHSIDHINRIHRDSFEGRIEHLLCTVVTDLFVTLGDGGHQLSICGQRRQYVRLLLSCSFIAKFSHRHPPHQGMIGEKLLCLRMFSFEILFWMRNACFPSWREEASCVVA